MIMEKIPPAVIAYNYDVSVEDISGKYGSLLRCCIHNFRDRSVVHSIFDRLSCVVNGRKQIR